jgi:magnesium-transporting ATPase (P-type)
LAYLSDKARADGACAEVSTLPDDLTLIGLVGMIDPPRAEAIEAVRECHGGGIRVTMITGDHATTAVSIAHEIGIGDGERVIMGSEIEQWDDSELAERCRDVDVFARTSPEHKLRLVRAMQASGQVVAMTGDGVNDAPALKQANVGVAMGIKGTEVSKEAAEMVLADDRFDSIAAAVREGRTVFDNIQKALLFILPTNGAQALTIAAAIFLGMLLPITPPQILWVNMVTSVTLALALAFEPREPGTMRRAPRAVGRPLLDLFGLWRLLFVSILLLGLTLGTFIWMRGEGSSIELSRTAAINALIVGQVFYLLNSRYFLRSSLTPKILTGNPWIPVSISIILLLQAAFTYLPWVQQLFGTAALPLKMWIWLGLGGLAVFFLIEVEKCILRQFKRPTESH